MKTLLDALKQVPWHLVRRWLYGVLVAAGALLTFYGVLPPEAVPLWLGLGVAVLNVKAPTGDDDGE